MVVSVCGHFGLWPFRSVAFLVCDRSGLWCFGLWPFRLWPFRSVAVVTCYPFDNFVKRRSLCSMPWHPRPLFNIIIISSRICILQSCISAMVYMVINKIYALSYCRFCQHNIEIQLITIRTAVVSSFICMTVIVHMYMYSNLSTCNDIFIKQTQYARRDQLGLYFYRVFVLGHNEEQ